MTHATCWLTAKNRDQLKNPTLGSRVWATFFTSKEREGQKGGRERGEEREGEGQRRGRRVKERGHDPKHFGLEPALVDHGLGWVEAGSTV